MHVNSTEIPVRYAETDQMGVVYHANYLIWCEIGRTNLIADLGHNYAELEKMGVLSPVTSVQIDYRFPVKYGETVTVHTWIETYNGLRFSYGYEIKNSSGKLCLSGTSHHVVVDAKTFKPIKVKRRFPDWHETYLKNKKQ